MLGISPRSSVYDAIRQFLIVVGSALFLALPMSQLTSIFLSKSFNHSIGLVPVLLTPGAVLGILIAVDWLPEIHALAWSISVGGWVLTALLWKGMGIELTRSMAVVPAFGAWLFGFGVATLIAFRDRIYIPEPVPG
ncbi:MAG: hypothetical protein ACI9YT_000754 [Halobacteriales archaeon]|jgi:hypothetical protein